MISSSRKLAVALIAGGVLAVVTGVSLSVVTGVAFLK
jgi:hypothetical protein